MTASPKNWRVSAQQGVGGTLWYRGAGQWTVWMDQAGLFTQVGADRIRVKAILDNADTFKSVTSYLVNGD